MAMKPQNLYTAIYQKETWRKRTDNKNSVDMPRSVYHPKEINQTNQTLYEFYHESSNSYDRIGHRPVIMAL